MARVVFISHAGADSAKAAVVAGFLKEASIEVRFDRQELSLGDSFLSFMESALSDSDYCLLLWSSKAALTPWVQIEWEAALYRSVTEKRAFLVAGRLEDVALPALLGPRLRVDLFPGIQPGVAAVIETWRADRHAENATQRTVASSLLSEAGDAGQQTVYVTSEAFGITVPVKADLEAPAGMLLDTIVQRANLPTLWGDSRFGVRLSYSLMNGEQALARDQSLTAQSVRDKSVLWLRTQTVMLSEAQPVEGSLPATTFREAYAGQGDPRFQAYRTYLDAVRKARLGL